MEKWKENENSKENALSNMQCVREVDIKILNENIQNEN